MKKLTAIILALTLAMGLVACGNDTGNKEAVPASALEVLETIWANVPEANRFPAMGGDMNNMVDNAPGKYALEDAGITGTLLVPAEEVAKIDDAASLVNAMMLNNFTCGVFHVKEDAKTFAETMYNAVSTNPWLCGMPEQMLISVIGGEYVLVAFGLNDIISSFKTAMTTAYATADIRYSEAIAE